MQAVLGLIEDDRGFAVEDFRRDLFAPMGGKAVHEEGVRCGVGHERGVHLKGAEDLMTAGRLRLLAHGRPHVRVDGIGVLDRGHRISRQRQPGTESGP